MNLTQDSVDSNTEDDKAFCYNWNKLSAENDVNFTFYMYL